MVSLNDINSFCFSINTKPTIQFHDLLDLLKVPDDEINKKPTTRKHQRKRPPPRQYYSSSDDDMFESDRQAGATMPAIVNLDSDDENAGMPISINRNFASELTALPMTENEEIKMIVKFGLELDEYMLRPVSS